MKRVHGQALTVVATAILATLLAPACAENDRSIFIRNVVAPPSNRQSGGCSYSDDPSQPQLFEGKFDVGVSDSYVAVLLVGNQLMARADRNGVRAESNRARINGAVVRVADPNGTTLGEFTSLATGVANPQSGDTPDYIPVKVTLIDPPTKEKIAESLAPEGKLVVAYVKAFGQTIGGVDLESGEFQFPIRVCKGCLISFETGQDPAVPRRNCDLKSSGAGGGGKTESGPCIPGQDEVIPCELCRDRPACRGE